MNIRLPAELCDALDRYAATLARDQMIMTMPRGEAVRRLLVLGLRQVGELEQ